MCSRRSEPDTPRAGVFNSLLLLPPTSTKALELSLIYTQPDADRPLLLAFRPGRGEQGQPGSIAWSPERGAVARLLDGRPANPSAHMFAFAFAFAFAFRSTQVALTAPEWTQLGNDINLLMTILAPPAKRAGGQNRLARCWPRGERTNVQMALKSILRRLKEVSAYFQTPEAYEGTTMVPQGLVEDAHTVMREMMGVARSLAPAEARRMSSQLLRVVRSPLETKYKGIWLTVCLCTRRTTSPTGRRA